MRKLDALGVLARLVVSDTTDRVGALSEAAHIVGAVIGSDDVRVFAGDGVNYEAYPQREAEDFFGLSTAGLLAASQELRRLGRPAVYAVGRDGLPRDVAPADGRCAGTHAAFCLWKGDTYGGTVVARGPWTAPAARRAGLFLESAGPALAIMLERVADADRTERVRQQMNVLADVARVFTRTENMRGVLEDVVNAINSATGFLSVIDVLDTRGRIVMRSTAASRYTGTPLYNAWLQMTKAPDLVRKSIIKDHQPVLLPDLQADPRISEEAREFYRRASIVSGATFPLLFQQELVGLLRAGSLKPASFGPPVVDLLQSLALQAAVVVKGVQLREQLQRSQKETGQYAGKLHARNQELLKEISERERAEQALREQARRDSLTGLLNHAAIIEELRVVIAHDSGSASCAVMTVDVDGLKAVNDTYGHQLGDDVLIAVAGALAREGATVGRYGGDEFVAILPGADRAAAERYRDAVLNKLTDVRLADPETGEHVPVVASMGLAVYPEEADSVADLISLSDNAMYAAKRQRPAGAADVTPARPLANDRAAEMVGRIVPLLTAPGNLNDKLRLVAHHLSVGAGYDAVDFALFAPEPGVPLAQDTFAPGSQEHAAAWRREERSDSPERHPIRLLFERTGRPVILGDPWNSELLLGPQREILRAAGLKSVLAAPLIWQGQVLGSLGVAKRQEAAFTPADAQFLMAVATEVTAIARMATLVDELQATSDRLTQAQEETVMLLAAVAEAHDRTTGRHLRNVRVVAEALARQLGQSEEEARELGLASVLHDIGKIRVPDVILTRTGRLDREEWELLKQHTVWGEEFLMGRSGFQFAASIARSHHERWDGSGYPDGLAGESIPVAAALVAVADAFDAITSDRPYSAARPAATAVREIVAESGKQFSPAAADGLMRLHKRRVLARLRHLEPSAEEAA